MIAKVQSGLTLLLLEAVFEEHDAWPLLPVILLVVHQDDHSLGIHVLSCVELEVTEFTKKTFHDPLNVVLEIVHVVRLLAEASLHQPVVEDEVDSRLGGLFSPLTALLGTGVGTNIKIVSNLPLHVLS